jgi:hypothetical protein
LHHRQTKHGGEESRLKYTARRDIKRGSESKVTFLFNFTAAPQQQQQQPVIIIALAASVGGQ